MLCGRPRRRRPCGSWRAGTSSSVSHPAFCLSDPCRPLFLIRMSLYYAGLSNDQNFLKSFRERDPYFIFASEFPKKGKQITREKCHIKIYSPHRGKFHFILASFSFTLFNLSERIYKLSRERSEMNPINTNILKRVDTWN